MKHKALLSTWCKTFLHARENEVFFLNTLKISLVQTLQEGPFQVMFVMTQKTKEQKELNERKRRGQDTTKISSAPAELCIQSPLCLALMNLLLGVVLHSSSLVTMAIPMSHWDYLSQVISYCLPTWILCSIVVLSHGERCRVWTPYAQL